MTRSRGRDECEEESISDVFVALLREERAAFGHTWPQANGTGRGTAPPRAFVFRMLDKFLSFIKRGMAYKYRTGLPPDGVHPFVREILMEYGQKAVRVCAAAMMKIQFEELLDADEDGEPSFAEAGWPSFGDSYDEARANLSVWSSMWVKQA